MAIVRRLADPNDRRGVMVELTDEGLEAVDAAVAANTVSDRQLLERLDPEEIVVLEGILRKLLGGSSCPTDRSADAAPQPTCRTPKSAADPGGVGPVPLHPGDR